MFPFPRGQRCARDDVASIAVRHRPARSLQRRCARIMEQQRSWARSFFPFAQTDRRNFSPPPTSQAHQRAITTRLRRRSRTYGWCTSRVACGVQTRRPVQSFFLFVLLAAKGRCLELHTACTCSSFQPRRCYDETSCNYRYKVRGAASRCNTRSGGPATDGVVSLRRPPPSLRTTL